MRLQAKMLGYKLVPPELTLNEISFRDLPLYTPDYDADLISTGWRSRPATST